MVEDIPGGQSDKLKFKSEKRWGEVGRFICKSKKLRARKMKEMRTFMRTSKK